MIQVLKKAWRQRLISLLLPILLVFAMAGVGVKVPAQAAGNDAGAQTGEMKVHFLDVGQGLSILVQSEGKTMIYDGGDKKTSRFVVAYLKEQGVTEIDYLISSHYDADHMAGLIGCLNVFDVKNVISSNYVHTSKLYKSFVKAVKADGLKMKHPAVGKTYEFGSGSFEILAPAVISCGADNKYGHPDKDTMDKLKSMEIQVYRTDKQGTITVTSNGTDLSWSASPCNDYTPGDASDQGTQVQQTEAQSVQGQVGQQTASQAADGGKVWVSATGSKYHKTNHCGSMNPDTAKQETEAEAKAQGLEPCKKCY